MRSVQIARRGRWWRLARRVGIALSALTVLAATAIPALSPGLLRRAVAAPTATTFQEGVSGYAGAGDTFLGSGEPDVGHGGLDFVTLDLVHGSFGETQGLIRFDGIFGVGAGQIPDGSTITSAELDLTSFDASNGTFHLHRMMGPWDESSTWNSMGSGIQTDGVEAAAVADASVASPGTGTVTFGGLETTVQAWSDGAPVHGWVLVSTNDNNWDVRSSEWGTAVERPQLRVQYDAAAAPLQVSKESDAIGSVYAGDGITYTITVTNPSEVIHTGVTVTDPLPPGTAWVDTMISAPLTDYIADMFDVVSYANQDGSAAWGGPWTETGDDGTPGGGDIAIVDDAPAGFQLALDLGQENRSIQRTVDLSTVSYASLSFDYWVYHMAHADEDVFVDVWDGASWNNVLTFQNLPESTEWIPVEIDLTPYAAADTAIRFSTGRVCQILCVSGCGGVH
ncbi:DUF11 domain-containing protein [bacterium]|nr:DUF11 domain-containing protein [bacterium]